MLRRYELILSLSILNLDIRGTNLCISITEAPQSFVLVVAIAATSRSSSKLSITSWYMSKSFWRTEFWMSQSRVAVRNRMIAGSHVLHYRKIITRWARCMIEETYNLVPAARILGATRTNSETKPWSSLFMERIVRELLIGFGRCDFLDLLSNSAANWGEGFAFGKPLESRFVGWEWAKGWHFVTKKAGKSEIKKKGAAWSYMWTLSWSLGSQYYIFITFIKHRGR